MFDDLRFRIRALLHRPVLEENLAAELEFHLEQESAKLVRKGKTPEEARRLARLALGGPEQLKEHCRDARGIRIWDVAVQDLRQAVRQLLKSRLAAACIILTLALCIGANTAVYSIVDALFFRSLPYPHPDRLALIATYRGSPELDTSLDGIQWEAVRDGATLLDAAAYGPTLGTNLVTATRALYIHQQRVSAEMFHVLGVPLQLGREFSRREDVPGGPALAVISNSLWRRVFNSDPNVLDRSVTVNGTPYTIVGVTSPQFRAIPVSDFGSLEQPDIYTPLRPSTEGEGSGDNYGVIARLKPGATFSQVNAQLKTLTRRILSRRGPSARDRIEQERALSLQAGIVYDIRTGIRVMWAAVLLVLVIGCVNIAGLLLARSSTRARELAMRAALGAGRFRILVQLMAESLLLGGLGAAVGILFGRLALAALIRLNPGQFTLLGSVELNGRVLLATAGIAFLSSLVFGFFPALQASRVDLRTTLAQSNRTSAGNRSSRARYIFVFAEIGLGVVLITAAGLLMRNLWGATAPYPGFDLRNLYVASASLGGSRYAQPEAAARLFNQSSLFIEHIPGVRFAGVAMAAPYNRPLNEGGSTLNGKPAGSELNYVSAGYFETMGLKCLNGRVFTLADNAHSRRVVVVNDTFVRFYSPGRSPVGSAITFEGQKATVIGVVNSVQENNHLARTVPLSFYPEIYVPIAQFPQGLLAMANQWFSPVWLVRTDRQDATLPQAMQKALSAVDPTVVFADFRSIESVRAKALGPVRYRAWVVSAVSGLALLLAAIGLYGVVAQSVTERSREMGIRLALGATIGQIIRTCVTPAIAVAFAGLAFGLAASLFSAGLLKDLVWNVSATDPATYLSVCALLAGLAFAASLLPALRLARISPAQILQEE